MKFKITAFLPILMLAASSLSAQKIMPKIKNVVENFFHTYKTDRRLNALVEFEKRADGWWLVPVTSEDGNVIRGKHIQYFDYDKQVYLPLPFQKEPKPSAVEFSDYIQSLDAYNFDLQPCYGYPGWYDDAIRVFQSKPVLTNDELFAKARAWRTKAISPVSNQLMDANKVYDLRFKPDALTGNDLQEYISAQDSAIIGFRTLMERDPDYPTLVGSIRVKYANEVMTKFQTLLSFNPTAAAAMKFPEQLYPDSMITEMRTMLEACPKDAILLSFGDNDLYPVLYLQAAMKVRPDVYCVNYNLLSIDKYIYRATLPQFGAAGIAFDADTMLYAGTRNDVLFIRDSTAGMNWPMLRDKLAKGKPNANGLRYAAINRLYLPLKSDGSFGADGEVSLKGTSYLYKNQWVIIGMIGSLRNGRPFCTHYMFSDEVKGLNRFLKKAGPIYIWGQ